MNKRSENTLEGEPFSELNLIIKYCDLVINDGISDDEEISAELENIGFGRDNSILSTAMIPHAFFRFVFESQLSHMENYYFIMDFETKDYTVHYLVDDVIYRTAASYAPLLLNERGEGEFFKVIQYCSELNAVRDVMSKGAEIKNLSVLPLTVQKWK